MAMSLWLTMELPIVSNSDAISRFLDVFCISLRFILDYNHLTIFLIFMSDSLSCYELPGVAITTVAHLSIICYAHSFVGFQILLPHLVYQHTVFLYF